MVRNCGPVNYNVTDHNQFIFVIDPYKDRRFTIYQYCHNVIYQYCHNVMQLIINNTMKY